MKGSDKNSLLVFERKILRIIFDQFAKTTLSKRSGLNVCYDSRKPCLLKMYSPQIQLQILDLVVRNKDCLRLVDVKLLNIPNWKEQLKMEAAGGTLSTKRNLPEGSSLLKYSK
uniref:Uncharacterized protein n=1 Tax=Megaselia scalaris TaxID=36166 RepID=T1GGR5_MEGSC